jgi:predicted extracellular nuclease
MRLWWTAGLVCVACVSDPMMPKIDAGPSLSVATIRNPASPDRPAYGTVVTVSGLVVTNVKSVGNSKLFFTQDPTISSWAGITIFTGTVAPTVAPGAVITATGTYTMFKGLDELDVSAGMYMQTGMAAIPAPIDVAITDINATGARALELQSMLLRIKDVTATTATAPPPSVEFTAQPTGVANGPTIQVSSYYVNDVGPSPFPATMGQMFSSITGNGFMSAIGTTMPIGKIAPGRAADVVTK